jgi:hypothetical protein
MYSLLFLLRFLLIVKFVSSMYNINIATQSVYLSGASYCDKSQYSSMIIDKIPDFTYVTTLYDLKTDLQGLIGYSSSNKIIYVSFRGSSSALNWMDDFEVKLVPYISYNECFNCKIHNGFYRSALSVTNKTIDTLKILQKRFPLYTILLTGHSYGASISQILAMEIFRFGFTKSLVYNFGQPRIGNPLYANFVNTILTNYWRFTHFKDIVPHLPPQMGFDYLHSCREVFETEKHELQVCSEYNCEDPECSDQLHLYETNTEDHLYYLDHRVSCEESTL